METKQRPQYDAIVITEGKDKTTAEFFITNPSYPAARAIEKAADKLDINPENIFYPTEPGGPQVVVVSKPRTPDTNKHPLEK